MAVDDSLNCDARDYSSGERFTAQTQKKLTVKHLTQGAERKGGEKSESAKGEAGCL
jgi:hypothetical protein